MINYFIFPAWSDYPNILLNSFNKILGRGGTKFLYIATATSLLEPNWVLRIEAWSLWDTHKAMGMSKITTTQVPKRFEMQRFSETEIPCKDIVVHPSSPAKRRVAKTIIRVEIISIRGNLILANFIDIIPTTCHHPLLHWYMIDLAMKPLSWRSTMGGNVCHTQPIAGGLSCV